MPKSRRKDGILFIKIITVVIFLAIIGVIVWTAIFISRELGAGSMASLSSGGTGKIAAEGPNTQLLQEIEDRLKAKTEKPLPDTAGARNPFLIPAAPPGATPAAPPPAPPIEQPPVTPPPPTQPPAPETPLAPPAPETPPTTP